MRVLLVAMLAVGCSQAKGEGGSSELSVRKPPVVTAPPKRPCPEEELIEMQKQIDLIQEQMTEAAEELDAE